jgi:hypothetical protein
MTDKVPNPDVADLVNTIDKVAQKRALIAATLIAVNASEFFTQDVEDMPGFVDSEVVTPVTAESAPKRPTFPTRPQPKSPAPEPIDIATARKAFHAQGVDLFGEDWEKARHWLIGRFTTKETPGDVRESTNELTVSELTKLRGQMRDFHPGIQKAWMAEMARLAAELATGIQDASAAEPHAYESPFEAEPA